MILYHTILSLFRIIFITEGFECGDRKRHADLRRRGPTRKARGPELVTQGVRVGLPGEAMRYDTGYNNKIPVRRRLAQPSQSIVRLSGINKIEDDRVKPLSSRLDSDSHRIRISGHVPRSPLLITCLRRDARRQSALSVSKATPPECASVVQTIAHSALGRAQQRLRMNANTTKQCR